MIDIDMKLHSLGPRFGRGLTVGPAAFLPPFENGYLVVPSKVN